MPKLRATAAIYRRSLKLIRRRPSLVAQTMILPTAVLLLVASVFGGGGDEWPVAVVNDSPSQLAGAVEGTIGEVESTITPYFDVQRYSIEEAQELVRKGRLHMLIHIPPDFEEERRLATHVFNVNTDATKNVRLRLDYALNLVERPAAVMRTELQLSQPHAVWRSAFIGGSAVLLALLLGSILTAANLVVFEHGQRTHSEMRLSPLGWPTAGVAIVAASVTTALTAATMPLVLSILLFNLEINIRNLAEALAVSIPLLVGLAGLGIFLGATLRAFRSVQPLVVMAALLTFFGGGGFVGTAMLQPAAQSFADWWPLSRIFSWLNPILHGFQPPGQTEMIIGGAAFCLLGLALVPLTDRIMGRRPPAQTM